MNTRAELEYLIRRIKPKLQINSVHDTETLQELGFDELDLVELFMTIEDTFGFEIDLEKYPFNTLSSVKQITDYINSKRFPHEK